MRKYFTKFKVFFHKVSLRINTLTSLLRETLYVGRVKLFADVSELHALFQLIVVVVRKTASPVGILQRLKKIKVGA